MWLEKLFPIVCFLKCHKGPCNLVRQGRNSIYKSWQLLAWKIICKRAINNTHMLVAISGSLIICKATQQKENYVWLWKPSHVPLGSRLMENSSGQQSLTIFKIYVFYSQGNYPSSMKLSSQQVNCMSENHHWTESRAQLIMRIPASMNISIAYFL